MKYTIIINEECIKQWGVIILVPGKSIQVCASAPGFIIDDSKCEILNKPGIVIEHDLTGVKLCENEM